MKHSLSGYAVAREGVDDTIIAVHKNKIDEFNEHLKKHSTSIQFTKEIEEDGKIAFLECFLTRENNTLRTTVYKTPTHTDRLLTSHNPTSHKASAVRTLTRTEGTKLFATQTTV